MAFWNRRKPIDQLGAPEGHRSLAKTLSWPHLIGLGVGAIVGTGIYTLIGVGADRAGPAVMLSFVLAGLVCACAALAYAELSTMMPVAGSAYTYSYAVRRSGGGSSAGADPGVFLLVSAARSAGRAFRSFLQRAGRRRTCHRWPWASRAGGLVNLPPS